MIDYHAVSMIYLDAGREVHEQDLLRLWSSLAFLGDNKVVGGFWHHDTKMPTQSRFAIGDVGPIVQLAASSRQPIFGGGMCATRGANRPSPPDCDFYYAHGQESRCHGYDTLPYLLYSLSDRLMQQVGVDTWLDNAKLHFHVLDTYSPRYGLVDVSASTDCYAGMALVPFFNMNCPLHRWLEHERWVRSCTVRRDQARGVYWGNYFGAAILQQLGGRSAFVDRFRVQIGHALHSPTAYLWEYANGIFISLSLDPLNCRPGSPLAGTAWNNAQWLARELRDYDAICR